MYRVSLTQSYFPAQRDDVVLETTVQGILRDAARKFSGNMALVEAKADGTMERCRASDR